MIKCLYENGVDDPDIIEAFKREKDSKKRLALLDEISKTAMSQELKTIRDRVTRHGNFKYLQDSMPKLPPDANPKQRARAVKQMEKALVDFVSGGPKMEKAGKVSLEHYIDVVRGEIYSKTHKFLEAARFTVLANKSGKMVSNVIDELFGGMKGKTGDADALTFAKALKETTDNVFVRIKATGNDLNYLDAYGIPIRHDSTRIGSVSREEWIGDAKRLFNQENMFKEGTDPAKQQDIWNEMYENLVSEGAAKIDPDLPEGVLENMYGITRHQKHRILQPNDGQAWREYMDKYGNTADGYMPIITDYLDNMSKVVGATEYLGSNPDKAFGEVLNEARRLSKDKTLGTGAQNTYDVIMNRTGNGKTRIGRIGSDVRSIEAMSKLPFAPIAATMDVELTRMTALMNDMPVLKTLKAGMSNLISEQKWKETRQLAARMQLGVDYALAKSTAAMRYADTVGFGKLSKYADATIRFGGLHRWTTVMRASFGLEYLSNLAAKSSKGWDELAPMMKRAAESAGITPEEWATLKNAVTVERNVPIIDPALIASNDLKKKVVGLTLSETNFAVPESTARARAILTQGSKTGEPLGEFARTAAQFHTFPVTWLLTHGRRGMDLGAVGATRYYAGSVAMGATLGMANLWATDLLRGNTPRDITTESVLHAISRSGLGGPYTDFIIRDPAFWGNILLGAGTTDAIKLAGALATPFANIGSMLRKEEELTDVLSKTLGKTVNVGRGLVPNTWYTKTLLDRTVLDWLQESVDPDWRDRQKRITRRLKERGQERFIEPGPEFKEPDLSVDITF